MPSLINDGEQQLELAREGYAITINDVEQTGSNSSSHEWLHKWLHKRTSAASRASSALLGDKALVPAWCCSPDSVTHNHEICVLVVVKGLEIVRQPGQPCTSTRGEWRREERTRTQHSVCSVKYWTKAPVSLALRYAGRNKALEGGAGSST